MSGLSTVVQPVTVIHTELQPAPSGGTSLQPQGPITVTHVIGGVQGPRGADGLPGTATGGDKNFVFDQVSASDTWIVEHSLNKFPSVVVVDSAGSNWEGHVEYTDLNHLTITFAFPFSGKAYLN